jgi:CRISPR-associated protein Cmr5
MSPRGNTGKKKKHNPPGGVRNPRYDKQPRADGNHPVAQQHHAGEPATSGTAASAVAAAPVRSAPENPLPPPPLVALARGEAGPNRRQRLFGIVHERITAIASPGHGANAGTKKIFGGLCHTVPVLLGTNGLVQTIAFIEHKIGEQQPAEWGDRERAFALLRGEIAHLLRVDADVLLQTVRNSDVLQYQRYTRTVLDAWIYYKRFAMTVLHVAPGGEAAADTA